MVDLKRIYQGYLMDIEKRLRLYASNPHDPIPFVLDSTWLESFVHPEVVHNSQQLGFHRYSQLIIDNIVVPKTYISLEKLVIQDDVVSARLSFRVPPTCTSYLGYALVAPGQRCNYAPSGELMPAGDGSFDVYEQVMYQFAIDWVDGKWKIKEVWSVVDIEPVRKNGVWRG